MSGKGTLITVGGTTDGASTTGTFPLNSAFFESPVSFIRIDKGVTVKLWSLEVSRSPVTVALRYTHDVTAPSPTWLSLKAVTLASEGVVSIDKRRPIRVITGLTGKEAIQFTWAQTTAALSEITAVLEFVEDEED